MQEEAARGRLFLLELESMRAIFLFGVAIVLTATAAFAHDKWGNPNWIANGHFVSPIDGSHCCGVNDCVELDEGIVHPNGVGYELNGIARFGMGAGQRTFMINEVVPYREVQVSRDGKYWRCHKPDTSRRCFFAPPPST
jgi:hypothetical protein